MSQINFANTQFAKFVNYANSLPNASESKAIVAAAPGNADGEKPLADRNIVPKEGDYVGKIFRNQTLKDVNNEVRRLFKDAVAKMFGGENNIPASVKSAMKLGDYGKGKPLTARRIIAVNNAIEKLKVESFTFADAFTTGDYADEMKMKAENAGHVATDFPKLSKGANLLAKATGMPLRSALLEVMDKSSAAYAAVQCGPLYTGSVADFKKGMEIQKEFKKLQTELTDLVRRAVSGGDAKDYAGIARIRVEQLKIAKQQAASMRYTGGFLVDEAHAGEWKLFGSVDDRIVVKFDDKEVLANSAWNKLAEGTTTVKPGWHTFEIRIGDGGGGYGTDAAGINNGYAFAVQRPGDAAKQPFDERALTFTKKALVAQTAEKPGLGGTTTVAAGATLSNGSPWSGANLVGRFCPIYGTLEGGGTLSGPFRFTGEENVWRLGANQRAITDGVTFANADDLTLAGLKTIELAFSARPAVTKFVVGDALGLTAEKAAEIAVKAPIPEELRKKGDPEDGFEFSATVKDGKLVLVSARPLFGTVLFMR